jgi:hypothetical protein
MQSPRYSTAKWGSQDRNNLRRVHRYECLGEVKNYYYYPLEIDLGYNLCGP